MKIGFIGTYTEKTSQGIYQFELDETTGHLSNVSLFSEVKSSKYLSRSGNYLFSLFEEDEAGVCVFDLKGNCLDKLSFGEGASCYITAQGSDIYTTNYHQGTVSKLHFDEKSNKLSFVTSHAVAKKAGCHQAIPFQDKIFAPCLHLDKVLLLQQDLSPVGEIKFPTGSGPRHGVLSKDGAYLYVIGELSNEVYVVDSASLEILSKTSILPEGEMQDHGGAALRLSEDGTVLYATTREPQNRITSLEIKGTNLVTKHSSSANGKHPRDILNVCQDRYLLVANRGSNTLHSLDIQNEYKEINRVEVPEGVSIVLGG